MNESDSDRQASAKGIDDENVTEGVALEKAGLIDLDDPEDAAKVETFVEVTPTTYDDGYRRSGHTELESFEQRMDFVNSFAINDAFQNPDDYNWGSVFDISDDMETYILSIKDEILQAESDDYEASAYNGFTDTLLNGIKVGHLKASLADDVYYSFIKEVLVAYAPPFPDDARLNLVTQNENNESRYEFYFHKDNLEVFKSLSELTCDKPYTNGWYYTPKDGWLWTNNKVFPFIYKNDSQAWLYFNSEIGAFYDYDLGLWFAE